MSIYPVNTKTSLKANAVITFNDMLVVRGFKVVEGKKGLFISKPSTQGKDGTYYDSVYLLDPDLWDEITEVVIEEYEGYEESNK